MHKVARTSFETILSMFCCFHRASLQGKFQTDSNELRNHGTLTHLDHPIFESIPKRSCQKYQNLAGNFEIPFPDWGFVKKAQKWELKLLVGNLSKALTMGVSEGQ